MGAWQKPKGLWPLSGGAAPCSSTRSKDLQLASCARASAWPWAHEVTGPNPWASPELRLEEFTGRQLVKKWWGTGQGSEGKGARSAGAPGQVRSWASPWGTGELWKVLGQGETGSILSSRATPLGLSRGGRPGAAMAWPGGKAF